MTRDVPCGFRFLYGRRTNRVSISKWVVLIVVIIIRL